MLAGSATPDAVGEDARGRVILVTGSAQGNAAQREQRKHDFDAKLASDGALAILVPGGEADAMMARVWHFGGDVTPLPVFEVARSDARDLESLARRGRVRVAIESTARVTVGPVDAHNVVADVVGRERPDEVVILGAHLDSWDYATGAQDNATGVAMVLEAARAIAASGLVPRRTIRFVLWAAEEEGILGSATYARDHHDELDRIVAVLNTDGGTGAMRGWTAPGRQDVADATRRLMRGLLDPLGPGAGAVDTSMQYAFDSDHAPFVREGIPTLDLNPDDGPYEEVHHKASDTLLRVDAHNLVVGTATVALTAFAVADAPTRLAPRKPLRPNTRGQ
jgi:hypothetical protein